MPSKLDSQEQATLLAQGVRRVSLCLLSQLLCPPRGSGGPVAFPELVLWDSVASTYGQLATPADRHLLQFSSVSKLKPENMKGVKILQYKYISCYNTLNLHNFELQFW